MKYTVYHTHPNSEVGPNQPLLVEVPGLKEKCLECQKRKVTNMPIHVIPTKEVPVRVRERGSPIIEIRDALEAIKTLKASESFWVELSDATKQRYSKTKEGKSRNPEAQLVIALNRTFASKKASFSAFKVDGKIYVSKKDKK